MTYILDTLSVIPITSLIILPPYTSLRTSEEATSGVVLLLKVLIIVRKHAGHAVPSRSTTTFSPSFPRVTSSHEGIGSAALGACDFFGVLIVDILLRVTIQAVIDVIISI